MAETSGGCIEFGVFDEDAWKRLRDQRTLIHPRQFAEKDCRTCVRFNLCWLEKVDRNCILGSRYEREEFRPLWRKE